MTTIVSPITGEKIREVSGLGPADADLALRRAEEALSGWRRRPASERGRLLWKVAEQMRSRADEVADLETLNTGKLLADTRREAERAAACFEYYAGYADKLTGSTIPVPGSFHTYTTPEPHGVVVGIIPWNVPYFFAAKKVAPALAFGNVSIVKPAEETPLTALLLNDMLAEAGVPEGVAQILPGGPELGRALVDDARVNLVVFTGHHETGRSVATSAARHLTPVALELGGKSPQIVFADADLDAALDSVVVGIFGACGQMCIAGSRLLVHESVHDAFVARLAARVQGLCVGDPRRDGVHVGPQVTRSQADKTRSYLAAGRAEGAWVVAEAPLPEDPELSGGFFVPPTVFSDVTPQMSILRDEIFGPVLTVSSFDTEEEALELAHATEFGLAAGVWTSDGSRAHRMARELDVGTVWVNTYRILSDQVPFGGVGQSGYGREGGEDAARLYTRAKSIWVATQPGPPPGFRL